MSSNSFSNADIDEQRWINQIRLMLEEEPEDAEEDIIPVSIFSVPLSLRAIDPDSYTPHLVSLGPYHRNLPHLLEMERYKLLSAKTTHKQLLKSINFQTFVDELKLLDPKIRASYHKHLSFSSEMLSWMMAIDAAFLLDFLQTYTMKQIRVTRRVPSNLFDQERRKSPHNAILRDIGMLENQIPLLVLRKMMELESVDDSLQHILVGLCKDLSPFEMDEHIHHIQASECAHVLDFLYRIVVPKLEDVVLEVGVEFGDDRGKNMNENERRLRFVELLLRFKEGLAWLLRRVLLSRLMKIVLALPLIFFCHLPAALAILEDPVENLLGPSLNDCYNAIPSVEEIMIPSVVELSNSGITFVPTKGGISAINFNTTTNEFCLPTVRLGVNSEVILRNLVAYEASSSSGPLVLARYTELMNGIIDSKEDARLLREKGIILNHLKSDGEVASLWNGMSKSLKLTKVSFLDRVIEDVNVYYHQSWRVRLGKFMKVHVFSSWQALTFVAALLFLFLMIMQLFSSLFSSSRRTAPRPS